MTIISGASVRSASSSVVISSSPSSAWRTRMARLPDLGGVETHAEAVPLSMQYEIRITSTTLLMARRPDGFLAGF